jgi:uncharacterized protein YkwD
MRHPPRGLLLAAVAGPVVLLGAGPAAADQSPADPTPTAGQTADATAGAAGTSGEPGTPGTTSASADSTSPSSSDSSAGGSTAGPSGSGTPAPETAPNGLISACTGACLVTLDELLTHMFDVLHPAESPSATPADASSGGTPPADSTGSGSGSNSSGSAAGSDSPPGTGDTVTVTTSDGTKLTGTVTAVSVTKLTITLTAPDDTTTAPADDTAQVLSLLNAERAKVSCPVLTEDSALTAAAQAHSVDMSTRKALTHTDASGADPFTRAQAAGVLTLRSENVADGQATPDEVVADWMQSAKHKANILDCGVTTAGIGVATSADGTRYWTADFGVAAPAAPAATPADASAPAAASDSAGSSASDTAAPTSSAPAGSTGGGAAPTD